MGKRKSAAASLEKLSRGLARETPATRAAVAAEAGSERPPERPPGPGGGEGGSETAAAKAARTATRTAARDRGRRKTGRPRAKPERMVRVSVDLPRPSHRYLRDFAYDAESDGMSVMRALLEEMREDEGLADRVLGRLAGR